MWNSVVFLPQRVSLSVFLLFLFFSLFPLSVYLIFPLSVYLILPWLPVCPSACSFVCSSKELCCVELCNFSSPDDGPLCLSVFLSFPTFTLATGLSICLFICLFMLSKNYAMWNSAIFLPQTMGLSVSLFFFLFPLSEYLIFPLSVYLIFPSLPVCLSVFSFVRS